MPDGKPGKLENHDFPSKVGANQSWTGSIDATNTGDETYTFRVTVDSEVKTTFDLESGESRTLDFSGTGPTSFTIKLERSTEVTLWEKYKWGIIVGGTLVGIPGAVYLMKR